MLLNLIWTMHLWCVHRAANKLARVLRRLYPTLDGDQVLIAVEEYMRRERAKDLRPQDDDESWRLK